MALLAAAAVWGLIARPPLAPSPVAEHHLPRPPGVRFGGSKGPSVVDLRLRWLWLQASPVAERAVAQGAGQGGRSRGDHAGGGGSYGRPGVVDFAVSPIWSASQPATLREAFRLSEGPWALPRPPEQDDDREGQGQEASADAVDGDESGSMVAWLMMVVLIAEEPAGRRQRVSRWPEHAVSLYGWWKGRADLVNPYVVLAAFALGGRVLRSGRLERAVNYGVVLGLVSAEAMWRFSMKVGKTLDDLLVDDQEAE